MSKREAAGAPSKHYWPEWVNARLYSGKLAVNDWIGASYAGGFHVGVAGGRPSKVVREGDLIGFISITSYPPVPVTFYRDGSWDVRGIEPALYNECGALGTKLRERSLHDLSAQVLKTQAPSSFVASSDGTPCITILTWMRGVSRVVYHRLVFDDQTDKPVFEIVRPVAGKDMEIIDG